jgi:hypothetical protein
VAGNGGRAALEQRVNSFGVRDKPRQNSPTKKIPHEITLIGLLAGNKGGLTGF